MSWFSHKNRSGQGQSGRDLTGTKTVREVPEDSIASISPFFGEIAEFWYAKRNGDDVPDWIHFSPHTHTKFLPHIILWEVVSDGYLARVTGEAVARQLPVKIANRRLHDVLTDDLSHLPGELDQAVAGNLPIYSERPNAWILDDETVHCQAIHLPFHADHGSTNRVLSVMAFITEPRLEV